MAHYTVVYSQLHSLEFHSRFSSDQKHKHGNVAATTTRLALAITTDRIGINGHHHTATLTQRICKARKTETCTDGGKQVGSRGQLHISSWQQQQLFGSQTNCRLNETNYSEYWNSNVNVIAFPFGQACNSIAFSLMIRMQTNCKGFLFFC